MVLDARLRGHDEKHTPMPDLNKVKIISRSDCKISMIECEQWPKIKIDSKSMPLGMHDHRKELIAGNQ